MTVSVTGSDGAVNVFSSAPEGSIKVLSGGTLTSQGPGVAYTNKTADPEVVEFVGPPQAVVVPVPVSSTGPVDCVNKFVSNPMCKPLPTSPTTNANSAAWAALLFQAGHDSLGSIGIGTGPGSDDGSEPLTVLYPGQAYASMTLACDVQVYSPGTCAAFGDPNGSVQQIPLNAYVSAGSDAHLSVDNYAYAGEFDFWLFVSQITNGGVAHVGGAGFCPWSGTGTNCSGSTATNLATSLGRITQAELSAAEVDTVHGSLPHAIAVSALCGDSTFVYPAASSDGGNTNGSSACVGHTGAGQRPPEGIFARLSWSDVQIDALDIPQYAKAILRTMDYQHYGVIITDTNWSGAPGLSPSYAHDSFAPQLVEAGLDGQTNVNLPIPTGTLDLSTAMVFCGNGGC